MWPSSAPDSYRPSPRSYGSIGTEEREHLLQPRSDIEFDFGHHQRTPAENGLSGVNIQHRKGDGDVEEVDRGDDEVHLSGRDQLKSCCKKTFSAQNILGKLPITKWLPKYRLDTFQADIIAGLTVGLTVIPQGLAYAQIASLPPQYGLYSAFMGCFVYCFMGTSKDITLGPTAIMSLMTATFGSLEGGDPTAAIILTLLSGVIQLVMGILQLGILVNFISYPVINAFTSAAAITIAFGQIKSLLGLKDISREFLHMVYETFEKLPETNLADMTMGLVCLVIVILLKQLRNIKWADANDPDRHISIPVMVGRKILWLMGTGANAIIVIAGAGVVAITESENTGINFTVTGHIAGGMPPFAAPNFSVHNENLNMTAGEIFSGIGAGIGIVPLLALVETMAIGKAFARLNGYKINPTQELLAIGTANIVSSFVSSYPITGSFSRTAVNSQCGVRTPMSGLWTGGLVILALCVLTPWFYYIPKAALAAVIIAAVIQMVDYKIILTLWRANKWDLIPLFITFITSLTVGIEYGILIGIGISILMLLYPMARPKVKYTMNSGFLVVTPLQGVNFPAAEYIEMKALDKAGAEEKPRNIIFNMEHLSDLDYTAVQSLKSLNNDCDKLGMRLILCSGQPRINCLLSSANIKDLKVMKTMRDAIDELSLQGDSSALGEREEEVPFMNPL